MKVTQCQKSQKFSLSGLTQSDMIALYHEVSHTLKTKIAQALIESTDADQCLDEFNCTPEEFWKNVGIEL